MKFTSLISADITKQHLDDPDWRIIDCQYDLADKSLGYARYQSKHLPNAIYAHLYNDLSSPITETSGRHPLPDVAELSEKFGVWGIDSTTQVVVYDDAFGSFAARCWWLLKWLGHENVALLNGGLSHWEKLHYPLTEVIPTITAKTFSPKPDLSMITDTKSILDSIQTPGNLIIDVRDPERYLGLHEPIDKMAGHIPGAINIPWKTNLDEDGLYLDTEQLRRRYTEIINQYDPNNIVFMCGSGVTACQSIIAMNSIGINEVKLYPGSWSEWIQNLDRPIETKD